MSKRSKVFLIVASVAAIAFLAMAVFVFTSFRVVKLPTGSMANTIVPGESVLCFLSGSEVKRGEIILFKLPTDPKVTYLKRVIGLPGDRIQIRGVKVFINGAELPEERTFIELTPSQPIQPELSSEG
ncbi:MAG TPA: signal peptidase I, partial [Blastocatellia bacterium]|nr:signal peptidase I [Blastocatellia bacterium]